MSDFNMPPGVSSNMIPGNRPEDLAEEAFWDALSEKFSEQYQEFDEYIQHIFEGDLGGDYDDALIAYVSMARDIGYNAGYADGKSDASLAQMAEEEEDPHSPSAEPHTCPYAEEISGDFESLCNCSVASTEACAWDI